MIEVLKKETNKSLQKTEEKKFKKLEEISKSLKKYQESKETKTAEGNE